MLNFFCLLKFLYLCKYFLTTNKLHKYWHSVHVAKRYRKFPNLLSNDNIKIYYKNRHVGRTNLMLLQSLAISTFYTYIKYVLLFLSGIKFLIVDTESLLYKTKKNNVFLL